MRQNIGDIPVPEITMGEKACWRFVQRMVSEVRIPTQERGNEKCWTTRRSLLIRNQFRNFLAMLRDNNSFPCLSLTNVSTKLSYQRSHTNCLHN